MAGVSSCGQSDPDASFCRTKCVARSGAPATRLEAVATYRPSVEGAEVTKETAAALPVAAAAAVVADVSGAFGSAARRTTQ
eukprot:scaffold287224_cov27-Tisochrysis_lutea.AAC.1